MRCERELLRWWMVSTLELLARGKGEQAMNLACFYRESGDNATVEMGNSAGKCGVFDGGELSGLVHHVDEVVAAGKFAGGFVEVAVVGGLAAEQAAKAREDVARVEAVEFVEESGG